MLCSVSELSTRELITSVRHAQSVARIEFSPDGRWILTASSDNSAQIWDARTGQPRMEPMAHEDRVRTAHFSPDGERVVTASVDGCARVWDAQTGRPLTEQLRRPEQGVRMAAFSPDGERIVSASLKGTVKGIAQVWEVPRASLPVPPWLPTLAEGVGGQRFAAQHTVVLVSWEELLRLKEEVIRSTTTDPWTRIAQRFFTDRVARSKPAVSPANATRLPE